MEKLEATYNKSIKIMYNLPWATHRNLMEPLTGVPHIRRTLISRYLSFMRKVQNSKKTAIKNLLNLVKTDVRTTTGSNLRMIMLLAGQNTVEEVLNSRTDIEYHKLEEDQQWKPDLLKEIIDVLYGEKTVDGVEIMNLRKSWKSYA